MRTRTGRWSELGANGGLLALHSAAAEPRTGTRVELCFVTEEPLEKVAQRLEAAGFAHDGIADESFGRLLRTTDPTV